jgi:hypothetical protein
VLEIADLLARAEEAEHKAKAAATADLRGKYLAMAGEWRELADAIKRGEFKLSAPTSLGRARHRT